MIKQGHRLLAMQRRLSSRIQLRRVSGEGIEVKENLIIADRCAIICQSINNSEKIWANFNNKAVAGTYLEHFENLWARSQSDKDLRQLEI
jgi:hypothetical protein